ncbi:MAG: TolC family protein, partial [Calditrichaeota bacterium]|nr:TolC family protein [Calditrichota bacterium]
QVQQQALEVSRQRLEKETVRREVGGSSSTDLLNAQVSFNSDRSNFINQELAVLTARQNLNLQLAQDPATEITVSDEMIIPDLGMNFDALFELAEQRNSALLAADYSRRAAAAGVGTANSAFLPRVNLNASYGYTDRTTKNEVTNQFRPPETNTTSKDGAVSLGLSWNLFNGFRDNITRQNAKIEEKISRLQLENTRIQLNGSLREKYETFRKQMELLALEQENVQAARQNLQLQQERLQLGSVSSLEFRDAQINLIRAETALITARFRARITRLEIDQFTGQLSIE